MNKLLIANWKMNLDVDKTLALANNYKKHLKELRGVDLIVAPSLPLIIPVKEIFNKTKIGLSGQNVAAFEELILAVSAKCYINWASTRWWGTQNAVNIYLRLMK